MKVTPKKGEQGKARKIKTWVEVHVVPTEPPAPAEPPVPTEEVLPTPGEVERRRVGGKELEEVWRVARVMSYLRVGLDGHRVWAINVWREEPTRKKLLLIMGGKAPRKELLKAGN